MMDIDNTEKLITQPKSLRTTGCNTALLLAYRNLKQRFSAQKVELMKLHNLQMEVKDEDNGCYNSQLILEKKVDQLKKSLQSKTSAYNALEATYKQSRENEEHLLKHSTEMEQILDNVMEKCQTYQTDIKQLKQKFHDLEIQNMYLKQQLMEKTSIPEVSVLKSSTYNNVKNSTKAEEEKGITTNSENQLKQMESLLYENKSLKTNMYWLTTELKTMKSKQCKEDIIVQRHGDSGGLEEGGAFERLPDERKDGCRCKRNNLSYVEKLQQTVGDLKGALNKNDNVINDLLFNKYGHIPQIIRSTGPPLGTSELIESYVAINVGNEYQINVGDEYQIALELLDPSDNQDGEKLFDLPELDDASVKLLLDELTGEEDIHRIE